MLYLKEANYDDIEKEYVFVRDILSVFILFIIAVAFIIGDYARKKGYVR